MKRTTRDRKPNRQAGYDYSTPGAYFVTVCVDGLIPYFGKVHDGVMQLNECGMIAERQWRWVFEHFDGIAIDEFVVMPDHIHGIVHVLPGPDGSTHVGTTLGLSLHGLSPHRGHHRRHGCDGPDGRDRVTLAFHDSVSPKYPVGNNDP